MNYTFSPVPPSKKNSKMIICRGARPMLLSSAKHKTWHEAEMWKLKSIKPKVLVEKCQIYAWFYFPDNRKRDMSNVFESIADILVDAEIIKDDAWQVIESITLFACGIDKENPRVEISII